MPERRYLIARAIDHAAIDSVADSDVTVAVAVGAHIARRGEARARRLFCTFLDRQQHGGFRGAVGFAAH